MGHGDNALPGKKWLSHLTDKVKEQILAAPAVHQQHLGSGGEFVCLEWSTWNLDKAKDICMLWVDSFGKLKMRWLNFH